MAATLQTLSPFKCEWQLHKVALSVIPDYFLDIYVIDSQLYERLVHI